MKHGELSMQITLRIKARLRQLGLKQRDLATIMNLQQSQISYWFTGYHNFTIKTLCQIQTALGINFFNLDNQATNSIPCLPCEFNGLVNTSANG